MERHGEGEISGVQFPRSDSGFPSSRAEQMALAHWPVEHSQTPIRCVDQILYDRFKSKFNLIISFSLLHFPIIKQLKETVILKQNSADIKTSSGLKKGAHVLLFKN